MFFHPFQTFQSKSSIISSSGGIVVKVNDGKSSGLDACHPCMPIFYHHRGNPVMTDE